MGLKAPDHEDLILEEINMVWQTRNLYDPPKAD